MVKVTVHAGLPDQGNLTQGEGSDSLKTALETRGKTGLIICNNLFLV